MNANKVKFWSYFWQFGTIFAMIVQVLIFGAIPDTNAVWMLFFFSLDFIITGTDYIIASVCKLPHIYSINQKIKKQHVTYYYCEMDWEHNFDKKGMIVNGVILIGIGLLIMLTFVVVI